ncbi:MAG: hypothetical protein V7720_14475 [Halioglobus sp.]
MKLPTYQFVAQMAAAFAVVASLGLVAYELKLSRDIAKADVYQQNVVMDQNVVLQLFDAEAFRDAARKRDLGEDLSKKELNLFVKRADISMLNAENVLYQHKLGLLDKEDWAVWTHAMEWMLTTPCYREFFEKQRDGYRKEFAVEIDKLYAKLPEIDCPSIYTE